MEFVILSNCVLIVLLCCVLYCFYSFRKKTTIEYEHIKKQLEKFLKDYDKNNENSRRQVQVIQNTCDKGLGDIGKLHESLGVLSDIGKEQDKQKQLLNIIMDDNRKLGEEIWKLSLEHTKTHKKLLEIGKEERRLGKNFSVIEEIFRLQLVNQLLDDADDAMQYFNSQAWKNGDN